MTAKKCAAKDCTIISSAPTSHGSCTSWLSTCRYTGNACTAAVSNCAYTLAVTISTRTNAAKRDHCMLLTNDTNPAVGCTYVDGAAACSARLCSLVSPAPANENDCNNWLSTCRWNGTVCIDAGTCASYTAFGVDDVAKGSFCRAMRNNANPIVNCAFVTGSATCTDRSCANAPIPVTALDCSTYLTGCTITNTSTPACIATTSTCSSFTGLPN